jgi:hypothetical protein
VNGSTSIVRPRLRKSCPQNKVKHTRNNDVKSYPLDVANVKASIKGLIEEAYMSRDEEDRDISLYIA